MSRSIESTYARALRKVGRSGMVSKTLHPTRWRLALMPFVVTITLYLCTPKVASAQGVGINAAGTPPDASAGLDVNFSDKGLLIPRMNTADRDAIASPANGLMILNTADSCFQIYNGVPSQ